MIIYSPLSYRFGVSDIVLVEMFPRCVVNVSRLKGHLGSMFFLTNSFCYIDLCDGLLAIGLKVDKPFLFVFVMKALSFVVGMLMVVS